MKQLTPLELKYITLEDIQRMQEEIDIQIDRQKEDLLMGSRELFHPRHGTMIGSSGIMKSLRTFYVVYSGIKVGLQFIRSFRKKSR